MWALIPIVLAIIGIAMVAKAICMDRTSDLEDGSFALQMATGIGGVAFIIAGIIGMLIVQFAT